MAPADFPASFSSVAEAMAYLQERVGFVTPALADKVVRAAASDMVMRYKAVVGWDTKPPRPLRSAPGADPFPQSVTKVVALRYVMVVCL